MNTDDITALLMIADRIAHREMTSDQVGDVLRPVVLALLEQDPGVETLKMLVLLNALFARTAEEAEHLAAYETLMASIREHFERYLQKETTR